MPAKQKTLPEILAELRTWPKGHPFQSIADEVAAAAGADPEKTALVLPDPDHLTKENTAGFRALLEAMG